MSIFGINRLFINFIIYLKFFKFHPELHKTEHKYWNLRILNMTKLVKRTWWCFFNSPDGTDGIGEKHIVSTSLL